MRVLIAAAIMAFGLTTAAQADLRYYIDHDVLRNNHSTALLHRAIKDIGTNPSRLVASLVRSAVGNVGRRRLEPREGLGALRTAFSAEARSHRRDEWPCRRGEGG